MANEKSKVIGFQTTMETYKDLQKLADKENRTLSNFIETVMKRELKKSEVMQNGKTK